MASPSLGNKTGVYVGTGVEFDIALNFTPSEIKIISSADNSESFKTDKMGNSNFQLLDIAAGTVTVLTANGITLGTRKFTIGTDPDINGVGNYYYWIAFE